MTKRLIIVDVSNFTHRAFYAIKPLHAPDGTPTNAVFGFYGMMLGLIRDYKPTHMYLARDVKGGSTYRNEIYTEYKGNRSSSPDELTPQFALIDKLIERMNIPTFGLQGFEADDVIGTACTQWKDSFDEILVATGDKDLMQFVGGNIKVLDTMKNKLYDEEGVIGKMGVRPDQIVDYLSMVGDTSDNIPGMRGIGPAGASKLLKQYDTLDNIVANKNQLIGKNLIKAFDEFIDDGILSKKLIQIVKDVPLTHKAEDTEYTFNLSDELNDYLKELGFNSLVRKDVNEH